MSVAFLHPHWGWLLLALPLLAWRVRPGVDRTQIALRAAAFAAIVVALMQPSLLVATGRRQHVFIVDQKAALTAAAREKARVVLAGRLARLPADDPVTLVQIGGTPLASRADRRIRLGEPASLSEALARAVAAVPPGAGATVTLITDGLSNDRRWGRAVAGLLRRGIPVDTVALETPRPAPFVSDLRAAPARTGETVEAVATVEGHGEDVAVALYSGTRLLATSPAIRVDGVAQVPLRFTAPAPGFLPIGAVLRGGRRSDAARFDAVAAIQPPLRLLYLGDRQRGGAARLQRLLGGGFRVETPTDTAAVADFGAWPLVMVDDVPARRLSAATQRQLLRAVEERGTGLLYAGGEAAFGDGGYQLSPLAAALPVTFRQEERAEKPSVAVAVVIDSSGSMQGQPLELAKYVARLAVRNLTPQDQFGVVEFYGAKQWAVPMQPVRDGAAIERAIGRMQAQGSSVLFPALQEAYYGVKNAPTRYKHVLVISDGDVSDGAFEQLIRHMAADRVNVSTVVPVAGERGIDNMTQWARWGLGRFYYVPDDASLVQIDLSVPGTTALPSYRPAPAAPRVTGQDWWRDIGSPVPPPVAGLVRVDLRSEADAIVEAGTPLLASWLYGRGRVTAMTTEPLGQGTQGWAGWPRYGEWLARVVDRTAAADTPLSVALERRGGEVAVTVQRTAGVSNAMPEARLERGAAIPLVERAPGLFFGTIAVSPRDAALVVVRDGDTLVRAADRAHSDDAGGRPFSALAALPLADLSRITGGIASVGTADGPAMTGPTGPGDRIAIPLWGWAALAALLCYLSEIAYRRRPPRRSVELREMVR